MQSVALRIIADREAEIDAFIPEEYWTLDAELNVKGERKPLIAKFYGTEKEKMTIESKEHLNKILKELDGADYEVSEIKKRRAYKKGTRSIYDKYTAAGSFQSFEFCNLQDDAYCAAAL